MVSSSLLIYSVMYITCPLLRTEQFFKSLYDGEWLETGGSIHGKRKVIWRLLRDLPRFGLRGSQHLLDLNQQRLHWRSTELF